MTGDLTIRGVAKPATLTANHFRCGPHPVTKKKACGGDFITQIKRSDFGMKYAMSAVADEVTLRINIEALID